MKNWKIAKGGRHAVELLLVDEPEADRDESSVWPKRAAAGHEVRELEQVERHDEAIDRKGQHRRPEECSVTALKRCQAPAPSISAAS